MSSAAAATDSELVSWRDIMASTVRLRVNSQAFKKLPGSLHGTPYVSASMWATRKTDSNGRVRSQSEPTEPALCSGVVFVPDS